MEAVITWVDRIAVSKGHDVTLVTAKGSSLRGTRTSLNIIETIEPSWIGSAEEPHYLMYKELLEKEYGDGKGVVWDNTWHCFSYLSLKKFPKMKILHTNHGMLEWLKISVKDLQSPRFMGLSSVHARYMSSVLKIPVKYVHNGIPLPPLEQTKSNKKNGGYLLSLNRIFKEKGIEDSIDLAIKTNNSIKIVGDDIHVYDRFYVNMIKEKCRNSRGYAQYIGLVDNNTKIELIKKCKAVIACPKPTSD